jgi:hypothetical protein
MNRGKPVGQFIILKNINFDFVGFFNQKLNRTKNTYPYLVVENQASR